MNTDSHVTFEGPGPFDLPASQRSYAESAGDMVTIGFRVLVSPSREEVVRIAVLNNQALALAEQISREAAKGIREAKPKSES